MEDGNYFTIFYEDERTIPRSILYKLESLEIVKMVVEKIDSIRRYRWELTQKGLDIVNKNSYLKDLFNKGNLEKFYNFIVEIIEG